MVDKIKQGTGGLNSLMLENADFFPWDEHIKGDNILRAVDFILSLDRSAIQKTHQPYAYRWLDNLKKQVEYYYKRTRKEYWVLFTETTRAVLAEQSRDRLQQQTIFVAGVLTSEFQQRLLDYLADPAATIPTIF
jgi:hypothetical protein